MARKQKEAITDPKASARALEALLAAGHISPKQLYLENFVRGIFFSMGGVIGATVLIGLIVGLLSLLDTIPFVGPIFKAINQSLSSK